MICIGIVGTRRRDALADAELVSKEFLRVCEDIPETEKIIIVSGGCPEGGDRFAEIIASLLKLDIIIHWPDKSKLPPNPKRWDYTKINYARNTLIARDSDILIACVADDRTGGTEDTIKKYLKLKKKQLKLV